MHCPICNFEVANLRGLASHFRHQSETHPDYKQWSYGQKWKDSLENEDYVACLECGHKAETLARHLKSAHSITAEEYKQKHGLDSPIRINKLKEKRSKAAKNRKGGFGKGSTKKIKCSNCGDALEVSKFLGPQHDHRCSVCFKKEEDEKENNKWLNLSEPEDYITCKDCGYRASNLTSHLIHNHPNYKLDHPDCLINSLNSRTREKTHQIGRQHSETTKQKMSENAGKWNLGLTKENNEIVSRLSKLREGHIPWCKGLTKENNDIVARISVDVLSHMNEGDS